MTPERRAALERCRGKTYLDLHFDDLWFVSEIALDDYPSDDKCEMSRQELIAEVQRLKRGDFSQEEFQNLCHNFDESEECRFLDGCRDYQRKLFGNKKPEDA